MAGSGYRRFARSRLYEYILVVMRFYYAYKPGYSTGLTRFSEMLDALDEVFGQF